LSVPLLENEYCQAAIQASVSFGTEGISRAFLLGPYGTYIAADREAASPATGELAYLNGCEYHEIHGRVFEKDMCITNSITMFDYVCDQVWPQLPRDYRARS
jgi:hypothetical protein